MRCARILFSAVTWVALVVGVVSAQTTEFSYQGSLKDGVNLANGNYDFEFALFDALTSGAQVGSTLTRSTVAVSSGIFTVSLDFGNEFPGANRFLEIRVRPTGGGAFNTLSPRQQIDSSPYSVKSLNTDTAANADQLGGVAASQYVVTTDPRLSDARPPTAGSSNYIHNTFAGQASSNFGISGTGRASIFDATMRYTIGGTHVLSIGSDLANNLFAGAGVGQANTTGTSNAFFGSFAGGANTSGFSNSFFGRGAGFSNTSGGSNSFFGVNAGDLNTTGSSNTIIGNSADVGASNLTNATAIGANARVNQSNSLILGSINGVNGATADTSVGIGTTSPTERLHVVGNGLFSGDLTVGGTLTATLPAGSTNYIQNTTSPQASSNFNISGNGTASGTLSGNIVNATTQYNMGGSRVLSNAGTDNLFAGVLTGTVNTGNSNAFFGTGAGNSNTSGSNNSFFGRSAGNLNTTGSSNAFFGSLAGNSNTTGVANAFFGLQAGDSNTTGAANSFFGRSAGDSNTTGAGNSFFGTEAGDFTTTGSSNSFFGRNAGDTNTTGSNNTIIGYLADVGSSSLTFATAIGSDAVVSTSNTVVLGRAADTVEVPGALNVAGFVKRQYTSTPVAAIPIAYGSIDAAGGTLSGTGNFTVAHTVTGEYNITITGETYSNDGFTVTITPVTNSPRINGVADAGTPFRVNMWNLAGTLVDNAFQFTIWKTNPN